MTKSSPQALQIARTYVEAMSRKDVDAMMSLSSDDVVCTSPLGQIAGIERFRGFQDGFARMTKTLSVLAVHGDDDQAVVVYEVETHPVPLARVAEFIKVRNGKLASTDVIYDGTPFAEFVKTVQGH
jgi:ketosteroid isomerase-like protein